MNNHTVPRARISKLVATLTFTLAIVSGAFAQESRLSTFPAEHRLSYSAYTDSTRIAGTA